MGRVLYLVLDVRMRSRCGGAIELGVNRNCNCLMCLNDMCIYNKKRII